jgi:hypothetical protein
MESCISPVVVAAPLSDPFGDHCVRGTADYTVHHKDSAGEM